MSYKILKLKVNQLPQTIIKHALHACHNGYSYKPSGIRHPAVKKKCTSYEVITSYEVRGRIDTSDQNCIE